MKKMLAGMLLAALALSMTACGQTGDSTEDGNASQETTVNQGADEVQKEEETPYAAGSWTDNVYTNESLGLTFALPEGWQYGTAEELAEVMGNGQEVTGYSDETLSATDPIYDLYIYNGTTGASMMMMAEDTSIFGDISAEEYLNSVSSDLVTYEDEGISYEIGELETLPLGKTDFMTFRASAVYEGVAVYQQYAAAENGGRFVTIIMTAPGENGQAECDAILSSIQPTA